MLENNLIDRVVFEELKQEVGLDFVIELVDTYREETPALIAQLQQAVAANDADGVRRAAHAIKSSSNNFGALHLGSLAQEIETLGKEGRLAGIAQKAADLSSEYDLIQDALLKLSHA